MSLVESTYLKNLETIKNSGTLITEGRTIPYISHIGGLQNRHNFEEGFPLLTTKKIFFKHVITELIWFLKGLTNIEYLKKYSKKTIWDEWADENGELGPIYGKQWRAFGSENYDQIAALITSLKEEPFSRRHILSAWHPPSIKDAKLPPCHIIFQVFARYDESLENFRLSGHLYQRSADYFLGKAFNIASYALLLELLSVQLGYGPPEQLVQTDGDAHIYVNHLTQVEQQLARTPKPLPRLTHQGIEWIDLISGKIKMVDQEPTDFSLAAFSIESSEGFFNLETKARTETQKGFSLSGYYPDNYIKAEVAI